MFLFNIYRQLNAKYDAYTRNKENILDWEGNIIEEKDQVNIIISKLEIDSKKVASSNISKI